ncbi:hypothetical protein [Anaerococcus rubeinfantis]|uniref:hypothetical protein n=1 Tax=Anaerococcus rubeinfantis TaxID=1720199 RepID=UPI00073E45E4|nr:hypothetical protein [Anaerococcus rubeinfantis]
MKKRGFLSIYVLIILTLLSISLAFIYEQGKNNNDLNKNLYDRKKAIYYLESVYNVVFDDEDRLIEKSEEINKIDDDLSHDYYFDFFNKEESVKIIKIGENSFSMNKIKVIGDSKAKLDISFDLKEKYNLKNESKIILENDFEEFFENLKFKEKRLEKYENFEIDKDYDNIFIKTYENLIIKKSKDKNNYNGISNKENTSNFSKSEENFLNKTKTARRISGIVVIGKDLILEKDLVLDGLLIIKGDIISENDSKLTINGQMISKNDYDKKVKYFYKKERSLDYINDIENPKHIEIKSKKVF